MSLSSALFASVTGIDSSSTAISVIGDNIANVSTPGFKERRAEFADVLGQSISTAGGFSQTGAGSRVAQVGQIFTQGSLASSARPTDLAIDGRGFFVLDGSQGRQYSRAGMFGFDNEGRLVNNANQRVQGFAIDATTGQPTGQLGDVVAQATLAPPRLTSQVDLSLNLANSALLNGPFDPANPDGTSEFATTITAYDSQGGGQNVGFWATRTGVNTWDWNVSLPPVAAGGPVVVQGGGTLTFDVDGALTGATGSPVTFNFGPGVQPNQQIVFDFGPIAGVGSGEPTTQFDGAESNINSLTQDGFAPGTLQGIGVDLEGFVNATFSNGETRALAQVALATFPNIEGLTAVGGNAFQESRESGQPLVGAPLSGQFGTLRANFVEQSNVDLAAQFIQLILNQRAFQANTRTVSTTNELLANLVQLGQ